VGTFQHQSLSVGIFQKTQSKIGTFQETFQHYSQRLGTLKSNRALSYAHSTGKLTAVKLFSLNSVTIVVHISGEQFHKSCGKMAATCTNMPLNINMPLRKYRCLYAWLGCASDSKSKGS
jgi:hypothetical protein